MAEQIAVRLDRKAIFGWAMFDFANSSFTTVMVTAYFSLYFQKVLVPPDPDGSATHGSFLWGLSQSISQLIVIFTAPIVGALADFTGAKKRFLFITYLGCSLLTCSLKLVGPGDVAIGMTLYIAANVFYSSGENIAGAFLPEIAPPHLMGWISGLAWGLGYIGGIGSLLLAWGILEALGPGVGYPWVWVMIGAWFLAAGVPTFLFLKEKRQPDSLPPGESLATIGFVRLWQTMQHARRFRQLIRFLLVYVVISIGVTAVIAFASIIADQTLRFDEARLAMFLIWCNIVAVPGAWCWGLLQDRIGSRSAIRLSLLCWLVALALVIFIKPVPVGGKPSWAATIMFWVAASFVGIGMGATSSSCRALVGLFSPIDRAGEFFGLWGLAGKLGSVIGPYAFGQLALLAKDIRVAEAVVGCAFIASFVLMQFVDEQEGRQAPQLGNTNSALGISNSESQT
jgi:UMF1 family MFS transporter